MVEATTPQALPRIFGQGFDLSIECVANRDSQAIPVHQFHHAAEIGTVIRAPLKHIELPLVNHFVRQCANDLLLGLMATCALGPIRLTNMPADEVSRWLHVISTEGRALRK